MKKIISLFYNDLKNIFREPMFLFFMLGPLLMSVGMKWLIPYITKFLDPYIDLKQYYPLLAGSILLFIPMLMGMLVGFLLLDEKDDNIFLMLIITPLGRKGYLAYRIIMPSIISLIYSIIILPYIDIIEISYSVIIFISLLASLGAPFTALLLAAIADNKVEGLAVSKGLGILLVIPIAASFISYPWRLIGGIIPYYWPIHTLLVADTSTYSFWIYISIGIFVHYLAIIFLIKKYEKKAY